MEKKVEGIYDGFKELGTGKMMVLGLQHVFAMFGATVLGTVNKSSQLGDSEVLVKQHSEVVLPWIEG